METLNMNTSVSPHHPRISVDLATINAWHAEAKREIEQTVMNRNSWYFCFNEIKRNMKLVYDKDNVQGYVADRFQNPVEAEYIPCLDSNVGKQTKSLSKVALSQAKFDSLSLNEIADSLYSDTTSDFRSVCASLYQEYFLDSAVLQAEKKRTSDDNFRFVGMRWIALQSSITGIGSTREYILFDSSGTSVDALGRTVLYSYFESKLLTPSDDPDRQTSLSRTSRRFLFREDRDGIIYYSRAVLHRLGDRQLPSWLYAKEMMQSFAHSFAVMRNIGKVADLRAILESVAMKSKPDEVALCDSKHCQVCRRKFTFIRLRYYCRSCGGSVCRRCTVSLRLFNEANQFSAALTVLRDRFCINCVLQARKGRAMKIMSRSTRRIEYIDEEDQKSVGFSKARNKELGTDNDAAQVNSLSISELNLFVKSEGKRGSLMNNVDKRSTLLSLADSSSIFGRPDEVSLTARNGMKAMHDLSKSIAQQEALLLSLLAEQRRRAKAFVRSTPPTPDHFSDSDRFEIIS